MRSAFGLAIVVAACAGLWLGTASAAPAASLQPVGSYDTPVFVTSDPGDPDRLFVVEQGGRIMLTAGGQTSTFLDLTTVSPAIVVSGGEQGLFSMAFAPDYAASGRFYVFYTGTDGGALHVDELTATGNMVDPDTRRDVITIPHPGQENHNGGQLQFGPDGYLYVATGDGGGTGDPDENGQELGNLLGKILRIAPTPGGGYTIPADNPFAGATAGADEIWSYGLRNPWRFSFDRITGALTIGDVGLAGWEEIDYDPPELGAGRGDNFGWDCREGAHDYETTDCAGKVFTEPVLEYPNPPSGPAAVAGGYVVRDPGLEELFGRYVYADTFAGQIRSFVPGVPLASDDRSEGLSAEMISSFGEDACARVYVASLEGPVFRIVDSTPTDCAAAQAPGDSKPPGLSLNGKRPQKLGDRRLEVEAVADEAATLVAGAEVVTGKRERPRLELGQRTAELDPDTETQVDWKLRRKQARRVRHLLRDADKVKVRFHGAATDLAGNAGAEALFTARLKRD